MNEIQSECVQDSHAIHSTISPSQPRFLAMVLEWLQINEIRFMHLLECGRHVIKGKLIFLSFDFP